MRTRRQVEVTCLSVVLLAAVAYGLVSSVLVIGATQEADDIPANLANRPKDRLREGTELLDVPGSFKLTGDRATFYPADGSGRLGGLENQTLERVATVIGEDPRPMEWLVTGSVTEFKGNNYILVTRAILKTKPSAPAKPGEKPL